MHYSDFCLFFFNDTATTEIYTLSLHDALPISSACTPRTTRWSWWGWTSASPTPACREASRPASRTDSPRTRWRCCRPRASRSEEHKSEIQSRQYLVCRLLLEKKKKCK